MVAQMANLKFVKAIISAFIFCESAPETKKQGNSRKGLFELSSLAINISLKGNTFLAFIYDDVYSFCGLETKDGIEYLYS